MEESFAPPIIMGSLLGIMLISGVPIAFVMFSIGILGCVLWIGTASTVQAAMSLLDVSTSEVLVCLPLFLFMAEIIVAAEIGKDLFDTVSIWTRRLKGGVAAATIIGCAFFAAICGSSAATIAAVGTIALWEMLRIGYDKGLACGVVGVGGTLGPMIPPSIIMIIFGALTDQSIGKLFMAGAIPGVIMAIGFILMALTRCYLNPKLAPVPPAENLSFKEKLRSSVSIIPYLIIFVVMFYAFYSGMATPTELAALGVLAAFIVSLAMRRLTLQKVLEATKRAGLSTAFVLFIIGGAKFFTFVISSTGISQAFAKYVIGLSLSPLHLVIMIMILYMILGCFIDPAGIMTLTIPVLLPVLVSANINLIWLGCLVCVNMELAYCTPPFGINLYVVKGVAPPEISMGNVIGGAMPFLVVTFLAMVLVMIFPVLALWLPAHM